MKLILVTLLSFLTLNVFSQLLPTFNLYIINPDNCQYTLFGTYTAYDNGSEFTGGIEFSQAGALDTYFGYLPVADSITYSICGIMTNPCSGESCTEGTLYMNPDGTFGSIAMVIMNLNMDSDGDGWNDDVDCDPFNSNINPTALEVCDGIDNNCDGELEVDPYVNIYFVPDSLVVEENTIFIVSQTENVAGWIWQFENALVYDDPYPTNYYASEGTYDVCLTALSINGCSIDTCLTFEIDSLGWSPEGFMVSYTLNVVPEYISNNISEYSNEIVVWPNPASDVINIPTNGNGTIEIYSFDGKMVYNSKYYGNLTQVDVSQMVKGSYVVAIKDDEGKVSITKFIK